MNGRRLAGWNNRPTGSALLVVSCLLSAGIAYAQVHAVWVRRYDDGSWQDDRAAGLALDSAGNVYVTGYAPGTSGDNDYVTVKYHPDGYREWAQHYDGPNHTEDKPAAIAIGRDGGIYVTGSSNYFSQHSDYATVKYDSAGVEQWVRRHNASDSGTDVATALAVDSTGDIVVSGYSGSLPDYDIITVKYSSSGDTVWTRRYAGPGGGRDRPWAMTVDSAGSVYVCGQSYAVAGSPDSSDLLAIKYGRDGSELWAARRDGGRSGPDAARGVAVDGAGNIYVCGYTDSAGGGRADYLTVKYNAAGETLWSRTFNGPGNAADTARAIALDPAGNVLVTGTCRGETSGQDYATIRYDPAGAQQWVRYYDHNLGDDVPSAIALDRAGNSYVTGGSWDNLDQTDFLTIKYSPGGDSLWTARYDDKQAFDAAVAVAVDTAGYVYVAGTSWDNYSTFDYATIKYVQSSGIEEGHRTRDAFDAAPRALIARNRLFIPRSAVSNPGSAITLLGISGRTVASLRAGVNDVSRLSPGVYFLRQGPNDRSVRVIVLH